MTIVIQEVLWSIWGSYSAIWSIPLTNVKWHSDPWPTVTSQPIRLSTNFMTLIPSLNFTDYEWFPWRICNGCGMPAGNAYPSGHLVPSPFWDLLMLQLLRPNSANLPCLYSTFHLEYPLVLSRFCMVPTFVKYCDITVHAKASMLKLLSCEVHILFDYINFTLLLVFIFSYSLENCSEWFLKLVTTSFQDTVIYSHCQVRMT